MDKLCVKCGNELTDDSSFCRICGTEYEEPIIKAALIAERKCLKCGTLLTDDDDFCFECGAKYEPIPDSKISIGKSCSSCGNPLDEEAAFCGVCGSKYNDANDNDTKDRIVNASGKKT